LTEDEEWERRAQERMQHLFPYTIERLRRLQEYNAVVRRLRTEGYSEMEILNAACNLVMLYRLGIQKEPRPMSELESRRVLEKVSNYLQNYIEEPTSPFPPPNYFADETMRIQLKGIISQKRARRR